MRFSTCRMSISVSSCDSRCSRRAFTSNISSTCCFCSSLSGRCAATVSARRPASSIPPSEVRISGGIFLFSFTYWSNADSSARRIASTSGGGAPSAGIGVPSATQWVRRSVTLPMRARLPPSTSTFTVPSGSFSICRMLETQPISYMSSAPGSSLAAERCATSRMDLPLSMAVSIALMDFGRPTKSGITMCGNTTTSRRGSSGYWVAPASAGDPGVCSSCSDMRTSKRCRQQPWGDPNRSAAACRRPTIICSSTTTLLTFSSVGSSYIVSSRTCSRIERRPRAPVLRASALVATAPSAPGRTSSSTPSMRNRRWYCLISAFLGATRISISAFSSSSSSAATTGMRPTNSGIRPYLIRSSGSTALSRS